ncbi:hypothetical protein [Streptomyces sp. NPDC001933]
MVSFHNVFQAVDPSAEDVMVRLLREGALLFAGHVVDAEASGTLDHLTRA